MTEKSFFHNGFVNGHSIYAPYDLSEYANAIDLINNSQQARVIYRTTVANFEVTAGGGMDIDIAAGTALVAGVCIVGGAQSLTVPANNTSYARFDRVVVRYNWKDNSVELAIVQGTPTIAPSIPAIDQDYTGVYEMSIARIYIPSGAIAINDYYIFDEREFIEHPEYLNKYPNNNIFRNSEFIAGAEYVSGISKRPATWEESTFGSFFWESVTPPPQQGRGNGIKITTTTAAPGRSVFHYEHLRNTAVRFTLRMLIHVLQGEVILSANAIELHLSPTADFVEIIVRDSDTEVLLDIGIPDDNMEFVLGQITLAFGDSGASYLPKKEFILFSEVIEQTDFYPGDYSATFNLNDVDAIGKGVYSLLTKITYADSGSAASSNSYGAIDENLRVDVSNLPNSTYRCQQNFVPYKKLNYALISEDMNYTRLGGGVPVVYISYLGCKT